MRRLPFGRLAPFLLATVALTCLPLIGRAEAPDPQKISFETVDKAILRGTFYPSAKAGPQSPCVLMVHKLGGDRQNQGWDSLAKALQARGFAVLTFDLRGHGDSTAVKVDFWKNPMNLRSITGANPKKEEIEFKEFSASYYTYLVNDIAAAKYLLEQKNNAKECNVADLIVIGAEDGAALASLWVATEWQRRRYARGMGGVPVLGEAEGKDIAAAVYLSIRASLGSGQKTLPLKSLASWVSKDPKVRDKVGMFFVAGKGDAAGEKYASYLYKDVLNGEKAKNKMIFKAEVPDTKLTGQELLKKSLPTEEWIVKYVADKVMEARAGTVWAERDLKESPLLEVPLGKLPLVTVP